MTDQSPQRMGGFDLDAPNLEERAREFAPEVMADIDNYPPIELVDGVCTRCGVAVGDEDTHRAWHLKITLAQNLAGWGISQCATMLKDIIEPADPDEADEPEGTWRSDRGFLQMDPVLGDYGGHIRAYQSSAADEPKLWISVEELNDLNDPASDTHNATIHLTMPAATKLRDQLTWLIDQAAE